MIQVTANGENLAVLDRLQGGSSQKEVKFLAAIGRQIGSGRLSKEVEEGTHLQGIRGPKSFVACVDPGERLFLDTRGWFVFLHQKVEELLGYRPKMPLGRHFTDY